MKIKTILSVSILGILLNACNETTKTSEHQVTEAAKEVVEKKPFTSTHIFTAKIKDIKFNTCTGETAMCPRDCGSSGDFANFDIIEYKQHIINGEAGVDKLKNYSTQLSDYYKKDFDKDYVKYIRTLKIGDVVTIHTDYVYDTTKSTVEPIENIIEISKE